MTKVSLVDKSDASSPKSNNTKQEILETVEEEVKESFKAQDSIDIKIVTGEQKSKFQAAKLSV